MRRFQGREGSEKAQWQVSFHATYFLTFESGEGVVLQLLGSQLGDKAPGARSKRPAFH